MGRVHSLIPAPFSSHLAPQFIAGFLEDLEYPVNRFNGFRKTAEAAAQTPR